MIISAVPGGGGGARIAGGLYTRNVTLLVDPPSASNQLGRSPAAARTRCTEAFSPSSAREPVVQAYQVGGSDGLRSYPQVLIGLGASEPCSFTLNSSASLQGFVTLPASEGFVDRLGVMRVAVKRNGSGNRVTLTNLKPDRYRMMFRVYGKDGQVDNSITEGHQDFDAAGVETVQVVLVGKDSYPEFERGFYLADIALNLPTIAATKTPSSPSGDHDADRDGGRRVVFGPEELAAILRGRNIDRMVCVEPVRAASVPAVRDRGRIALVPTLRHLGERFVDSVWRRFFPQSLKGAIGRVTTYDFDRTPPLQVDLSSVPWDQTKKVDSSLMITVRRASQGRKIKTIGTEGGVVIQAPAFDNRFSRLPGTVALELNTEGTGVTNIGTNPIRVRMDGGGVPQTLRETQAVNFPLQKGRIIVEIPNGSGSWKELASFQLPGRDTSPVGEDARTQAISFDD